MPDLNKKTMSRKNVIGDVGITVEVINDDQPGDGTSQETAQATVTYKGGKPPSGQTYEVHFELLMSDDDTAIFTDTTADKTQGTTDENGVVTKYFTDSVGETGQLIAYVKMDSGGNPEDQKPFTFEPIEPDHIDLDLQNNGAIADSGDYITAPVTATKSGNPFLARTIIHYQLTPDENDAQFYSTDGQFTPLGKKTTAETDPTTGITKPSPQFKSSNWEEGTCNAWWDVSQENKPPAHQDYQFNAPQLQLKFNPLTTQVDGAATIVECPDAPAAQYVNSDRPAGFTATANVTKQSDTKAWVNGGDALFTLSSPNAQAVPNQNGVDHKDLPAGQYFVAIDNTGQATMSFFDTSIETGTVSAYVPDWDASAASNTDTKSYAFHDPWNNVSDVELDYAGGTYQSAWIYANGVQQAQVNVTLTLTDKNGQPLSAASMPSDDTVSNAIKLLDYDSGDQLGAGSATMWSYSTTPNPEGFVQETGGGGSKRAAVRAPGDGKVTLTYYVTCSPGGSNLRLGLSVQPTGGVVIDTGNLDTTTGIDIGQYQPGSPNRTFAKNAIQIDNPLQLDVKVAPIFDVDTSLAITASHIQHDGENDAGPANGNTGPDADGNYWRQWDYSITISDQAKSQYGSKLFLCVLDDGSSLPSDYCFAEQANSAYYTYKAYLWPTNIKQQWQSSSPTMQAFASQPQKYNCKKTTWDNPILYVTLYMTFAGRPTTVNNNNPVRVRIYDQYGTYQTYTFSQADLPQYYGPAYGHVPTWKPLAVTGNSPEKFEKAWRKEDRKPVKVREGVYNWGELYLYHNRGGTMRVGAMKVPKGGWCEAFLSFDSDQQFGSVTLYGSATEGDPSYASTCWAYFFSNWNSGYDLCYWDQGDGVDNVVMFTGDRGQDDHARLRLTPYWNYSLWAIVFQYQGLYLTFPGYNTSPGRGAGTHLYCYLQSFEDPQSAAWQPKP